MFVLRPASRDYSRGRPRDDDAGILEVAARKGRRGGATSSCTTGSAWGYVRGNAIETTEAYSDHNIFPVEWFTGERWFDGTPLSRPRRIVGNSLYDRLHHKQEERAHSHILLRIGDLSKPEGANRTCARRANPIER